MYNVHLFKPLSYTIRVCNVYSNNKEQNKNNTYKQLFV